AEEAANHLDQKVQNRQEEQGCSRQARIGSKLQIIVVRVVKVEADHRGLIVSETQPEGAEAGARQGVVADQAQAVPPDWHSPFELEIVCLTYLFKTRQDGVQPDPDPVAGGADQEDK